jgi:hypothetical protein
MEGIMRLARDLAEDVWYEVTTAVNVGEPLFRLAWALVLLYGVLRDAKKRFKFEIRGLVLYEAGLSCYIKPADGYELPKIMQWVKQTFSVRFNVRTKRKGHVWGGSVLVGDFGGGSACVGEGGGLGHGGGGGRQGDAEGRVLRNVLGLSPLIQVGGENQLFAQKPAQPRGPAGLTDPVRG